MNEAEINHALDLPLSDDDDDFSDTDNCTTAFARHDSGGSAVVNVENLRSDLLSAFKIVDYLMWPKNKSISYPFVMKIEKSKFPTDFYERNEYHLYLKKIYSNILSEKYDSIQSVVRDLRLMLENCYRCCEESHPYVKKGLKLEAVLEQRLALLPSNLRVQTTLEATSPHLVSAHRNFIESVQSQATQQKEFTGTNAESIIYQCVREEKAQEQKERLRLLLERQLVEEAMANREAIQWEEALLANHTSNFRNMWELPQIGHFLHLAQKALNLPEVSQYELERSLLMPSASSLLANIMSSLLSSHHQRAKLDQLRPMSCKTWEKHLKVRLQHWYKVYASNDRNLLKVFNSIGVEPDFFRILGDVNPFETKSFLDLTLQQKVWVLKSLCDYALHNHRTVQDSISEADFQNQNASLLGEDRDGHTYIYFPQFCGKCLRIYRMSKDMDFPRLDFSPSLIVQVNAPADVEVLKELSVGLVNNSTKSGSNQHRSRSQQPKFKKTDAKIDFELVVDSVEALRSLVDCFVQSESKITHKQVRRKKAEKENAMQPICVDHLSRRLQELLVELEPREQDMEQSKVEIRRKLKKEWDCQQVKETKQENEIDNFWGSDSEVKMPGMILESSNSFLSDFEEDFDGSEFWQPHKRACTLYNHPLESESSSN